ncbi:hypothetical protein [Notoacmeibacter marinus]|uniref:hypothetical protein n=1 Tax=Notoacmeibacter marinus TaxID=1876515 RepID=UPI001FE0B5CF|nr:hypothetical protein [Notoacmeibacter marinus]
MIFLNIVLLIGVIGFLCWLLFTLAVYALPLFVGVTAGLWAHGSGAGIVGGIAVGVIAAGATATIGQLIFDFARPLWIRLIVALLFAAPAAVAGYAATHGIAKHLMPSEGWLMAFSVIGAIAVGITALFRMTGAGPHQPGMEHAPDARGQSSLC